MATSEQSPLSKPTPRSEEARRSHYEEVCNQRLNLDKESMVDGWTLLCSFLSKCTSDEDKTEDAERYWFAAAIWIASQKPRHTLTGTETTRGNGISISQIVKATDIKTTDFFTHTKHFMFGEEAMKEHLEELTKHEMNFGELTVLFRKYDRLFQTFFSKGFTGQGAQAQECHALGWTLFLVVKGSAYAAQERVEVVSLFNLLICVLNLVLWRQDPAARTQILESLRPMHKKPAEDNPFPSFRPDGDKDTDKAKWTPQQTLQVLTESAGSQWDDVQLVHKEFATTVRRLAAEARTKNRDVVKPEAGDEEPAEHLVIERDAVDRAYNMLYIQAGGLDERVWLSTQHKIATPSKMTPLSLRRAAEPSPSPVFRNLQSELDRCHTKPGGAAKGALPPASPLPPMRGAAPCSSPMRIMHQNPSVTPVSTRRQAPPPTPVTSQLEAVDWLKKMDASDKSLAALKVFFQKCSLGDPEVAIITRAESMVALVDFPTDVAETRRTLVLQVYYRVLLNMVEAEQSALGVGDFSTLLHNDTFHRSLIATSLEAVIHSYKVVHLSFPFVLTHCDLDAFDLSKVILNFVKHEPTCPMSLRKHLKAVDETICDALAWRSGEPIYTLLMPSDGAPHGGAESMAAKMRSDQVSQPDRSSATALFHKSPVKSEVKTETEDTVKALSPTGAAGAALGAQESDQNAQGTMRGGAHARDFFLRKVLFFSAKRVKDLVTDLPGDIPDHVVQQVWEALKHCLMEQTQLMVDRHLDQIILCVVYGVAKNNAMQYLFKDIIEAYKKQNQAQASVYRSVRIQTTTWNEAKKENVHIERDSIIQFYNHVFLPPMKSYFTRQKEEHASAGGAPQAQGLMQPPASSPRFQRTLQVGSPLRSKAAVGPSPGARSLVAIGESPMQQQEFAQINNRLRAQRRGRPDRLSFDGAEAAQQEKKNGGDGKGGEEPAGKRARRTSSLDAI